MDSTVEAAVAAKLLRLFPPQEDKFLTFPMSGLGFTSEELDFLRDGGELSAEQIRAQQSKRCQFARVLNQIPRDTPVYSTTDSLLWAQYSQILNEAIPAESILTDAEQRELKRADAFLSDLRVVDGVKTPVYSKAVEQYYVYRDAYEQVERAYLDEKSTVDTSGDATAQQAWADGRGKELDGLREKAYGDWVTLGKKEEVERWQRTKAHLGGKIPRLLVARYLDDFRACNEPDIVTNDPLGTYSTFYSPSNSFDRSLTWAEMHLEKKEIESLVQEVPAELKAFVSGATVDLDSVTIEYAKVVVMRPWFEPVFFTSSYWKLPQGDGAVSSGLVPRTGTLPAFITNMIVARSIKIERTKAPSSTPTATQLAFIAPLLLKLPHRLVTAQGGQTPVVISSVTSATAVRPPVSATPAPHVPGRLPTAFRPHGQSTFVRSKMLGTTVMRLPHVVLPLPPKLPAVPATARTVETLEIDGVVVLAFECRRIPKSPTPDPSLKWE